MSSPASGRPLSFDELYALLAPDELGPFHNAVASRDTVLGAPPSISEPGESRRATEPLRAPWAQLDFTELRHVAALEAGRVLSPSAGAEVDDVASQAMHEMLVYVDGHTVENPGGLVRIIARRLAFKARDRWERDRRNEPIDGVFDRPRPFSTLDTIAERLDVDALLATLTADELRLVELKMAGFADLDIAVALDVAPQTVRNRLVGLRRELRARWEQTG